MNMYEECLEGNFKSIERIREAKSRDVPIHYVRQVGNYKYNSIESLLKE